MHLRDATDADLGPILAIYNHAIVNTTAVFSYAPHTLDMRREWFETKRASGTPVIVAEDNAGAITGFATYGPFRAWPAYKYSIEHSVYVAEHARRQGIARALMTDLIARARAQHYHAIIGGVVADNIASLRLHAALGFREVAHFREVGYKFGRWLDLKFVELLLPTPAEPREP